MENFSFDLVTRRCSTVPVLRYLDSPAVFTIELTGRPPRQAANWRAAVATERTIDDDAVVARINGGISCSGSELTVPVDTFFAPFRDAVENRKSGRPLFVAIYGMDEDGHTVEYIEFPARGLPAIDPPDGPPADPPDRPGNYPTRDEVIALIEEFAPGAGSGGVSSGYHPFDNPAEFTVLNEIYGRCVQLDATTPAVHFANSVWGISSIRFRAVSANPDVTGNAVLIAIVDGVEREPVTVAVGATPGTIEIPLDPAATGQFAIKRDVSSENDTLQDGEPVSLLLLNAEVKK